MHCVQRRNANANDAPGIFVQGIAQRGTTVAIDSRYKIACKAATLTGRLGYLADSQGEESYPSTIPIAPRRSIRRSRPFWRGIRAIPSTSTRTTGIPAGPFSGGIWLLSVFGLIGQPLFEGKGHNNSHQSYGENTAQQQNRTGVPGYAFVLSNGMRVPYRIREKKKIIGDYYRYFLNRNLMPFSYCFSIKLFHFIEKTPPDGVVDSMIFEMENHRIPSHYDLHIKNFNSDELKFLIEYQYQHPRRTNEQHACPGEGTGVLYFLQFTYGIHAKHSRCNTVSQ